MLTDRLPRSLPRPLARALDQLRRDVVTVGRRLKGQNAPPLVRRGPRAAAFEDVGPRQLDVKASVDARARELIVARVVRETEDAVTLVLADGGSTFDFLPGQFFTLLVDVDGETVPRNYSASNVPGGAELHLTIKRKVGGRVSGRLFATKPGDVLRVLGPFGAFTVDPSHSARGDVPRRLVLVAGGSGITPLAAIARTVLERDPLAAIALVFANRREEDAILAGELARLAAEHSSRFSLVHVLEEPKAGWDGEVGRLDRHAATRVLDRLALAADAAATFYVCGPDPMRDEVLAALELRRIDPRAIRVERFAIGPRPQTAPSVASAHATALPGARPIAIRMKGSTVETVALPGATLLEAGLAAGVPMPFSCGAGGCGACRVRLVSGDVEVEEPSCLDAAERANGYVLTCVGRACGPCEIEIESGGV